MRHAALAFALILTGCATSGLTVHTSGPVTYVGGDGPDVRAFCRRLIAQDRPWCVRWTATHLTIACPRDEYVECGAHEVHHFVDPAWVHPEGTR